MKCSENSIGIFLLLTSQAQISITAANFAKKKILQLKQNESNVFKIKETAAN